MSAVEQARISALDEHIASLPDGPWYRRSEVAGLLGVSSGAVAALDDRANRPELSPKVATMWAGRTVKLYSAADVQALHAHFTRPSRGAGRPRLWTAKQARERRRRIQLARYYRLRAAELAETDEQGAAAAQAEADRLQKLLDAQADRRKASRVAG